ncbi:MAG TPA: DUF1015 domain-containing protein, partial [Thermoleophilaceae bacterium]|nr:DUF1015 domain-containing protein [Thermoleophilaceae bacterium]
MADLQPLLTLRYEPRVVGSLEDVIAPPYDVIDDELRARLAERSPYNVVHIDLPPSYPEAAATMDRWRTEGALAQEEEPAVWVLRQDYAAPDGQRRTRTGILARVRVDEYGPGRIRPHERTHPGPKEDRLQLTRATKANLSPIFSLFPDRDGGASRAMAQITASDPFAAATDLDGTARTRTGFFARIHVDDYGAGRIRPHERTHPGPKEDRLRLTRATHTNLSPIFSLFPDRDGGAGRAMAQI